MTKLVRKPVFGATLVGLAAIILWASLAALTVTARGIPPFQLLALTFGVAFIAGLLGLAARGSQVIARVRQPAGPWWTAFVAIALYHVLYFYALATIPPEQASLIAYLWPLLLVLFATFAAGGASLQMHHLIGAVLGLAGTVTIFIDRQPGQDIHGAAGGYMAAFGCALVWPAYSVVNRRFANVPSEMIVGVCGAVAATGFIAHWVLESTVAPDGLQWLAILVLGIGPTGLAFMAWDHATKHGNVALLGTLSYLAPLLSTVLLVLTGQARATGHLALAALLIVGGAVLARLKSRPTQD